jgi:hypothetical protein
MEMSTVPPDIARFVTGEAALHLDERGQFTLASAKAPANVPIISADRAGKLATAYVRTFGADLVAGFPQLGAPRSLLKKGSGGVAEGVDCRVYG